jgi:hypothetical protein
MFWGVSDCFVTVRTRGKWAELVTNALVRETKSRQNFLERTDPIHPIGLQNHIFASFGPFHYCMNFGKKWAELVINA